MDIIVTFIGLDIIYTNLQNFVLFNGADNPVCKKILVANEIMERGNRLR
jgi:hypothetical protein